MKGTTRFASGWMFFATVAVLAGWFSASPISAAAQSQGNNAVYYELSVPPYSALCCQGSRAFIDASMFKGQASDICGVIYYIFTHGYPSSGTVVDARGLNSTITSMTCAAGTTPWNNGSTFVNVPSTILLPAGTIVIPTTWVLPNNTTVIGEGDDSYPPPATASSTALQACLPSTNSCSFTGTDMIDLGTPPVCPSINGIPTCNNVSVERLALDGQGQSLNGIVNSNAQTGSHVDHVRLYQIRGTGLLVGGHSFDSGPYSNIVFDTGTYVGDSSTVCVNINGQTGTRGFHNLTCVSETNDATAAVLLDSSNNSLEDVRIVGFYDGIRVGANANAQSNVLINIIGDTLPGNIHNPPPINVVHITSMGHLVSDISIMGANNAGGSTDTFTIQD